MNITTENTLALAVDYQDRLIPVMNQCDKLVENTVKLVKGLTAHGVPILFSQQYTKGLGMTNSSIQEACQKEEFTYYDKVAFSCMKDETIKNTVEQFTDRKNIILFGIEAHICVLQTALDLLENGHQVYLVCDCTESRKTFDRDISFRRVEQAGGILTTLESVLFELTVKAGTPEFKVISKLIV